MPQIAAPEGGEDGQDGDGKSPVKADAPVDGVEIEPGVVLPFVPPVPVLPAPQVVSRAGGTETRAPNSATASAEPVRLPSATLMPGKKGAKAPDVMEPPNAEDTP